MDTGYWFTTENGTHIHADAGQSKAAAISERFNRKDSEDWYHNELTDAEKAQMVNAQYSTSNLNKYLYDKKFADSLSPELKEKYEKEAELTESALSKFELKDPITTYRGVSSEEATNIIFGQNSTESFKSSSYDKGRAEAFAKNQGGWVVEYHISPGKHGADVNGVPGANESEFLLNKDVKYKSTNVNMADKKIVVEI